MRMEDILNPDRSKKETDMRKNFALLIFVLLCVLSVNSFFRKTPELNNSASQQNIIDDITDGVGFYGYIGNADKFQLKFPFFSALRARLMSSFPLRLSVSFRHI